VKKAEVQQKWWSALSSWLEKHQGRADFLFVYDRKQGRLDRCFDRNVALGNVDAETIDKLYQAAAEGRLGLLRPNDLKPHRLTTNLEKVVAPEKESLTAEKEPEKEGQEPVEAEQQEMKPKAADAEPASEPGLDIRKVERAAAEPAMTERMRKAEVQYRQVVYAPKKPEAPAPVENSAGENAAAKQKIKHAAAMDQAMEIVRNAVPSQSGENVGSEQAWLAAALAEMILGFSGSEARDEEERERKRLAREELIAAQNMFIWAAASDKRDREAIGAQMEGLEWTDDWTDWEMEWQERLENVAQELFDMDLGGASEADCNEKIRSYLDGERPARHEPRAEEEYADSNKMWGNALRHFCRFAASVVPLSTRHVQVAAECQKILRTAKEEDGLTLEDLGLNPEEQMNVMGTIEMGKLVARGLVAQATLTTGHRLPRSQYRECLKDYMAMKGLEETLIPHVEAHQKEISTGDGPVSAMQVLMANPGFHASDLRAKAGRTNIVAQLEQMDPHRVARMIRQGSDTLAEMGRRVMVASCQMGSSPEPVRKPAAPQKGGPVR
jgi:hypothetical protein